MGSDGLMRLYRSNVSPAMNISVLFGLDLGPVFTWLYVWLFADDISHLVQDKDKQLLRNKG